jgi:hypothetical protein
MEDPQLRFEQEPLPHASCATCRSIRTRKPRDSRRRRTDDGVAGADDTTDHIDAPASVQDLNRNRRTWLPT